MRGRYRPFKCLSPREGGLYENKTLVSKFQQPGAQDRHSAIAAKARVPPPTLDDSSLFCEEVDENPTARDI